MPTRRQSGIELLRILAMIGIVARHYAKQAGNIDVFAQCSSFNKYWLEVFFNPLGKVGVVLFFAITAWFLCNRSNSLKSSCKRIWIMERELLFWSLTIATSLIVVWGVTGQKTIGLTMIVKSFLPLSTDLWWYPTSYAVFLVILPFLNAGLRILDQKQHFAMVVVTMLMWTIIGGWIPQIQYNMVEMNFIEFIYLFVLISYLKLYGKIPSKKASFGMILAGFLIVALYVCAAQLVFIKTDSHADLQSYIVDKAWTVPVLLISFGMFAIALQSRMESRVVNWVAQSAFATYLISQHPVVANYLWNNTLDFKAIYGSVWLPLASLGIIILVFIVCTLLDLVRRGIFALTCDRNRGGWFEKAWQAVNPKQKIELLQKKISRRIDSQ